MINGIHHVTAIASDPQANLDFYVGVLGLKLVKITINYDDPGTYHFYYGDGLGRPGTILTFFPIAGARPGKIGTGQVISTALSIPVGSGNFWRQRFQRFDVRFEDVDNEIAFHDPDGMALTLVEVDGDTRPGDTDREGIQTVHAIRGIDSVTLQVAHAGPSLELLTERMGFTLSEKGEGRFVAGQDVSGNAVYLLEAEEGDADGKSGSGTVHHVAFRLPDDDEQLRWREELIALGYHVSDVRDRQYFHSIYFREQGGVLFELATDHPGFLADGETDESLGTRLQLPDYLESRRAIIEAHLPKFRIP